MDIQLRNADSTTTTISVSEIFECPYNEPLLHQVVTTHQARGRAGTRAQKNRSAVSGGGIKPWRQKGTGRARAGTSRSPIWRKGGVTFAAQPKDYMSIKLPKKMYRHGMRVIWSELFRQNRVTVVDNFLVESFKTRDFKQQLNNLGLDTSVLVIVDILDEKAAYASRNLPNVDVIDAYDVNPVVLMQYQNIVTTETVLRQVEEKLA